MTEPTDREQADREQPLVVNPPVAHTPVLDGAEELQAEAAEAIESGEVDLSDPRHGGPSVVEEPPRRD